jgi:GLPGLI family protein
MTKTIFRNLLFSIFFLAFGFATNAQITAGKITFERKTNLLKRFSDPNMVRWLGEKNKTRIDLFDLYFNDSMSLFIPHEIEGTDELSWATNRNTVYQNIKQQSRLSILNVWGENLYVQDSLVNRKWKITDSKRKIGKYECRKAIWEVNDSTRIYAWFSDEIIPSVGPETFTGLPGAILGVANEDGGVIYFAKTIEIQNPDMTTLAPKIGKNKTLTSAELRVKLEKQFGSKPEFKGFIVDLFTW